MLDIKTMKAALEQLEAERGISKEKIFEAIEAALAAAYKKDYGKKGQIVRAKLDLDTGKTDFVQVKIVVDDSMVRMPEEGEEDDDADMHILPVPGTPIAEGDLDLRIRFNAEHHIMIEDARLIKRDVELGEDLIFPLEMKDDYGRIAAQTAKQVIIQKIREAEKASVLDEFASRGEEIVSGAVQRIERGNVFVDLGRATGFLGFEDQIPGERYRPGERIRAYLSAVEESPRGVSLRLSRSHPNFVRALFSLEAPEISSGVVEIKAVAREAGSRTKIAVASNDPHVDPIGSCVGQRGVRVSTVMSELGNEKIDIALWSADPAKYIADALSPAEVRSVEVDQDARIASVEVLPDQLSLAIGRGGQNVRLAAKLTGYRIDIHSTEGAAVLGEEEIVVSPDEPMLSPDEEIAEFLESENADDVLVAPDEEVADDTSVEKDNLNAD